MSYRSNEVEPELLWGWLSARSLARGLPLPVRDRGGMRVDTASASEYQRFVFPRPAPAIRNLAQAISAPRVFLKLCGSGEQLRALVPARWQLQPPAYLMIHEGGWRDDPHLPAGYVLEVSVEDAVRAARILAGDGSVAASGYAVEYCGVFIADRIVTAEGHRRRGLGRVLMKALAATQRSDDARRVLVATEAGRALYATFGWTVLSPYSSCVIPD